MLETLSQDEQDFVDELLFADIFLWAFQFVRAKTHNSFNETLDAVHTRKVTLGIDFSGHTLARVSAFDVLSQLQETVQEKICVVEGSWDGDSFGWFIRLEAIVEKPSEYHSKYTQYGLCAVRGMDSQVERATALGEKLAQVADTTFYLTSVEIDDEKRWWDMQP